MGLERIYELGGLVDYDKYITSVFGKTLEFTEYQKKLTFVFFPYTAKDVIYGSFNVILAGVFVGLLLSFISPFLMSSVIFLTLIVGLVMYIFPTNIYYTQQIMEYSEEMLRAVLHLSTYIQTGSSMEYAFLQTEKNIHGILKKQFNEINVMLERKQESTLGDAMHHYIQVWSDVNPQFVKGIRLLQIAGLSPEKERDRLIAETVETLMVDYQVLGKRSAEELSKNTKMLIAGGVLMPILSLLVLPILAVFMPQVVRPDIISFLYVVFFPVVILVASLSFASKRIQVDTIRLEDHKDWTPMPKKFIYISLFFAVVFAIPSIPSIVAVLQDPSAHLDNFVFFFLAWMMGAGLALGVKTYTAYYVRKYEKLWSEIDEVEKDLPFVLQSFSTYYTLNTPFEKVVEGVVEDYERLGFHDSPVVKGFKEIQKKIYTSKKDIDTLIQTETQEIFPSQKVRNVISQIVSFEGVSQESAAKAARTVRQQVINTYKLDDYIKTLLSDTVGMIRMSASMLAPLLCASAVIMTYAILRSTDFITERLEAITQVFGGEGFDLELIDTSEVISPIFIAAIIGVYLVLITVVLSIFQTQINTGSDKFRIFKSLNENMLAFVIYSFILFGGYFFVNVFLFQGILAS